MDLLNSILATNRSFIRPGVFPPLPKNPKKQFAIFTCMDTRLVDFLEPAMGIKRGDAKVIKNAGNRAWSILSMAGLSVVWLRQFSCWV